jgi:hypothetical protein
VIAPDPDAGNLRRRPDAWRRPCSDREVLLAAASNAVAGLTLLALLAGNQSVKLPRPFSLSMGFAKRAFRGVFIGENAHGGRGVALHPQGKWSSGGPSPRRARPAGFRPP